MKIHLKVIVIFFTSLTLSACSTTVTAERAANQTYQGESIDELVSIIGLPQSQYAIANGDIQYGWLFKEVMNTPKTGVHNGLPVIEANDNKTNALSANHSVKICQLSALADNHNMIRSVNFEQNTMGSLAQQNVGSGAYHASMCTQILAGKSTFY